MAQKWRASNWLTVPQRRNRPKPHNRRKRRSVVCSDLAKNPSRRVRLPDSSATRQICSVEEKLHRAGASLQGRFRKALESLSRQRLGLSFIIKSVNRTPFLTTRTDNGLKRGQ